MALLFGRLFASQRAKLAGAAFAGASATHACDLFIITSDGREPLREYGFIPIAAPLATIFSLCGAVQAVFLRAVNSERKSFVYRSKGEHKGETHNLEDDIPTIACDKKNIP